MFVLVAIITAVSGALIAGTYIFMKTRLAGSASSEIAKMAEEVNQAAAELTDVLRGAEQYASKAQFDSVMGQIAEANVNLSKEKDTLKLTENKLDTAQKDVEAKETHHQEMKAAKDEDEARLAELLASYEDISSESISLEQKLASSMKNLDKIMEQLTLTDEQRAALTDLSNSLTSAGSRLRDLLLEYSGVRERLQNLNQQHNDLEEEYTRLVEQQLGE